MYPALREDPAKYTNFLRIIRALTPLPVAQLSSGRNMSHRVMRCAMSCRVRENSKNLMALSSEEIVQLLKLEPLPGEGGYFRRNYCSKQLVTFQDEAKPAVSNIIYLIDDQNFSALHRLKRDEVFHFYCGASVEFLKVYPDGKHELLKFGSDFLKGERPYLVVEGGVWQGLKMASSSASSWALMGTTVAPAFEYEDFEIGRRASLIDQFPHLKELITAFTREEPRPL